ncbi:MAG TPA: hypothetical protein VM925_07330, partial [Labilithrix sp.]|nr:hypothetical protein [Labilithrix sp.]
VVTFSEGPPKTRVALYLRSQNAVTRIATLADGRPALVGMATENGELTIEEGEGGQRPIGPASSYGTLGRIATNATGSIAVATSSESAFVRSANGEVATRTLSDLPIFGTQPVTATVGIGNDGRLFRVTTGGPPSLLLEDRSVSIDGNGSVRGAAFTTLGADTTLPALALVRGDSGDADRNSFELAIPSGDGYARVEVVPAATPCKADPQCSSSCTEENVEVEPQEIALAWDGSRALAAFVRRAVTRDRRYQRKQGSGIVCDFIGCDPYCSSSSSGRTTSADLVIAAIDVGTRTVRELFALPLEVQASMQAPLTLPASSPMELRAYARDGHLHVALTGKYQGSFDAVSVYRFRTSP